MQLRIVDVIGQRCSTFDIALVAINLRGILKRIIESLQHGQRRKNSNTAVLVYIGFMASKLNKKKFKFLCSADFYEEYTRARTRINAKLSQRFCTCQKLSQRFCTCQIAKPKQRWVYRQVLPYVILSLKFVHSKGCRSGGWPILKGF